MCGRYGYSERQVRNVAAEFDVPLDQAMQALFDHIRDSRGMQNHAPTMRGPVLRPSHGAVELLPWGFMSLPQPDRSPHLLINARSETVSRWPSFREAWKGRRCLVITDYFYEWQAAPAKGRPKQPWRFRRADDEPMVMAGIWSPISIEDESKGEGYAVITTTPAPTVAPFHDRMPVILNRRDWRTWMDPGTPPATLKALQRPYDGPMTAAAVSTALNNARYHGPVDEVSLGTPPLPAPTQPELF